MRNPWNRLMLHRLPPLRPEHRAVLKALTWGEQVEDLGRQKPARRYGTGRGNGLRLYPSGVHVSRSVWNDLVVRELVRDCVPLLGGDGSPTAAGRQIAGEDH